MPSATGTMNKAIGYLVTGTVNLWDAMTKRMSLTFIQESLINFADSGTSAISLIVTVFENYGTIIIQASSTLATIITTTIDMAIAIGVLALVLSITGISLVVLRKRRG